MKGHDLWSCLGTGGGPRIPGVPTSADVAAAGVVVGELVLGHETEKTSPATSPQPREHRRYWGPRPHPNRANTARYWGPRLTPTARTPRAIGDPVAGGSAVVAGVCRPDESYASRLLSG